VPLSVVGLLQYIGPTLQFLVGVWILREPFNANQLVGFCFIWAGLVVFAVAGVRAAARAKAARSAG
jgi:chloramphenicol-sensitive protein RarD